ncbi:MAG: hypothetical protein AB7P21_21085 [Lautropia sp.]
MCVDAFLARAPAASAAVHLFSTGRTPHVRTSRRRPSQSHARVLRIGSGSLVRVTGLHNPCAQIEAFKPGLLAAVLGRMPDGQLVRKAGVMGIVLESGTVHPGDPIAVEHTPHAHTPLRPV